MLFRKLAANCACIEENEGGGGEAGDFSLGGDGGRHVAAINS